MKTKEAIRDLLKIVAMLHTDYADSGRKFTLDGKLVGDLGEIIVADNYAIELYKGQTPKHDGKTKDGREVQIKATFKNALGFPSQKKNVPDFYIGIKIHEDGTFDEIFNGPGKVIWDNYLRCLNKTTYTLRTLSLKKLKALNDKVSKKDRIPRRQEAKC